MRIALSAICVVLIAGCGGGSSSVDTTASAAEVKTFDVSEAYVTRQALDAAIFLYNRIPAPNSSNGLSPGDIKFVQAAFDKIGDAILR